MASTREEHVYSAKLAEEAERYEEMADFVKAVVFAARGDDLTVDERNLLSVAYKNAVGARRKSWRAISSVEQREQRRGNESRVSAVRTYKSRIESELSSICLEVLKLLDSKLIDSAASNDSKVFYLKMKGDYYRYIAEFMTGRELIDAVENTLTAYTAALEIADAELTPTHPIRLGLALNLSVFYHEILSCPVKANDLARKALDEAVVEMDTLGEGALRYQDSTQIMQLLRDNLASWNPDEMDDSDVDISGARNDEYNSQQYGCAKCF